jgi:hypothetical protein
MDVEPPVSGARLCFTQQGMDEEDDDVRGWALPDGGVLLEVRGPRPLQVRLRAGDVVEVAVRSLGEGEDTAVSLLRDGARTQLASGSIAMTVGGLHGPTLAAQLRACTRDVGCEVRLRHDAR